MMTVGICDDAIQARQLLRRYIQKEDADAAVVEFENGADLLRYYGQKQPLDILFLDIDFADEPDGMETAKQVKKLSAADGNPLLSLPLIIFVTGLPERMPEAFSVHAFWYIVKPPDEKQFRLIYRNAAQACKSFHSGVIKKTLIEVAANGKTRLVPVDEIRYIECSARKIRLYLDGRSIEYYGKMKDIQAKVDASFFQTHRSFIVNLSYVFDYSRTQVELTDGSLVPMSKYKYRDFIEAYMRFCRG